MCGFGLTGNLGFRSLELGLDPALELGKTVGVTTVDDEDSGLGADGGVGGDGCRFRGDGGCHRGPFSVNHFVLATVDGGGRFEGFLGGGGQVLVGIRTDGATERVDVEPAASGSGDPEAFAVATGELDFTGHGAFPAPDGSGFGYVGATDLAPFEVGGLDNFGHDMAPFHEYGLLGWDTSA